MNEPKPFPAKESFFAVFDALAEPETTSEGAPSEPQATAGALGLGTGSASAMPQIPPSVLARMKRLRRRRAVMKWLEKFPFFKR